MVSASGGMSPFATATATDRPAPGGVTQLSAVSGAIRTTSRQALPSIVTRGVAVPKCKPVMTMRSPPPRAQL